jgi:SAM-dependent methyltransferase
MSFRDITTQVERYYQQKVLEHGPVARGVDWNSPESQELRFRQLLKLTQLGERFSINDFGCGYGALVETLIGAGTPFSYRGFDLSDAMVEEARTLYGARAECSFTTVQAELEPADFTIASGIFNVRLEVEDERWHDYVVDTIEAMAAVSRKGIAFNMLTSYSDPEYMRPDLYYADPAVYFDHCMRRFDRRAALLHDYGLYEFTILARCGD